jgi:hypothetical protein
MAAIVINTAYTLAERLRRTAPDGSSLSLAQVLDQVNDVLKVMPTFEANDVNAHKEAEVKSEEDGDWVDYNEYVSRGAITTGVNTFKLAMLKKFSTPARDLIDDDPDPMGKRMQEASGILKGMTKNMVGRMFYGNSGSNTKQFTGLASYLDDLSQANVIGAGGTGSDLSSIFAVATGRDTVFMVHPKGNPSFGVTHTDMGPDIISNTSNEDLEVYRDKFEFKGGLVVKDRRAIGRIANIESSGTSNIFDEDDVIDLHMNMLEFSDDLYYFANRTVLAQIWKRIKDKNNVLLSMDTAFGKPVATLLGRPIFLCDQLVNTESAIT